MTLATLQAIQGQLEAQQVQLKSMVSDKPAIQYCNMIELLGALQLLKQLIAQEQLELQAPPGATGPVL